MRKKNLIGIYILKVSVIVALLFIMIFSGIQIWLNYQTEMSSINKTFSQINDAQLKGITSSLWNYSLAEVSAQTEGLTHFTYINFAEIQSDGKIIATSGIRKTSDMVEKVYLLEFDHNGERVNIGQLTVQADISRVRATVVHQISQVLFFRAITIIIVLVVFLFLIDREITHHLVKAAEYFKSYDVNNLDKPLVLDKKMGPENELDLLVTSFNEMRSNLSSAIQQRIHVERKHATLLESLPGMAFKCLNDPNWTMSLVSAGAAELTGYYPDEIIYNTFGSFKDLIFTEDQDLVWTTIQKGIQKSQKFEVSYRIHTKTGDIKWVLERGVGIENETGAMDSIEGFIIDITEQKQRENELSAIASISYELRSAKKISEMLPIILNQTVELLHVDGGTIELIENTTGEAVVMYAIGLYSSLSDMHFPIQDGLKLFIHSGGKIIHSNNAGTGDPPISPKLRNICHAIAGAPLMVQGNLIGFLWIGNNSDIPESVVKTLSSIADIAANAIHRAELSAQTEQRLRRLISLRKIDAAINSNQEIGFTLNLLLEQTLDQLRVDAADILLLKADNSLSFESGVGFNTPLVPNMCLTLKDGPIRQSILDRRTITVQDINQLKDGDECKNRVLVSGYKGYFIVPLIAKNDVVGILEAYTRNVFSPDQDWIEFFETLAGQAAIAFSDSRLVSDLRKSNFELQLAYDETIAGWSSALDLRDKETEGHQSASHSHYSRSGKKIGHQWRRPGKHKTWLSAS